MHLYIYMYICIYSYINMYIYSLVKQFLSKRHHGFFQTQLSGAECLHARLACQGIRAVGGLHSH